MRDYPEAIKRKMRELAGLAYERELHQELTKMVGARLRVALSPLCCGPKHGRASVLLSVSQENHNM